jgi:hypothetical protein
MNQPSEHGDGRASVKYNPLGKQRVFVNRFGENEREGCVGEGHGDEHGADSAYREP